MIKYYDYTLCCNMRLLTAALAKHPHAIHNSVGFRLVSSRWPIFVEPCCWIRLVVAVFYRQRGPGLFIYTPTQWALIGSLHMFTSILVFAVGKHMFVDAHAR